VKTNFNLILKSGWTYGLLMAGISVILGLLVYIFNINMFSFVFSIFYGLLAVVAIPATFGILACNTLRAKYAADRIIGYFDAVLCCLVVFVIGLLISNLFTYVLYHNIDPAYLKSQTAKMIEMLEKYNLPQEKIDESIAKVEKGFNIGPMLRNSGIIAVVLSLILSIFVRKRDKLDEKML
jgi:hypothetical protein